MKGKLLVLASATALMTTLAVSAQNAKTDRSKSPGFIPPAPPTRLLEIPPQPNLGASGTPRTVKPKPAGVVTIMESRQFVATINRGQRFVDYINLKPGQERLPLTLTFENNGFNWLNVSIGGYPVLVRQNIQGRPSLAVNLTGNIGGGSSQVLIDAYGPRGAKLAFTLTAPMPTVSSARPDTLGPGDTLSISGKNLCPDASSDKVMIGGKKAEVASATESRLDVKVPDDVESGQQKVEVFIAGYRAGSVDVSIKAAPELTSMSLMSGPPGQEVIIYGKNFSKNPGENQVIFGDMEGTAQATVVSGDATSLTVIVPEITSPLYNVPVTVQVGKLKSKNQLTFMVQSRVF